MTKKEVIKPELWQNKWWMDCSVCGKSVTVSDEDVRAVKCSHCTLAACYSLLSEEEQDKLFGREVPKKPAGWNFMSVFVDYRGNVYHKGEEQPDLKDTLPPTKVKTKAKVKKSKTKRRRRKKTMANMMANMSEKELFKLAKFHKAKQKMKKEENK
jgi:hypothetical protein